jgi:putative transposase
MSCAPSLRSAFCIEAVEEALTRHGTHEIFNIDQGRQSTPTDFMKVLADREIKTSMDRACAWPDSAFVELLWRNVKYEESYLRAFANVSEADADAGIG